MKHLLIEAASLDKILNALAKGTDGHDGSQSELADLIMADPTAVTNSRGKFVGKYWKWIYNQYKQGNIHEGDIPELQTALNTYNINKSRINKPITEYKTLDELVQEIAQYDDSFKAKRTLSKGEQELEKVYEDEYVTVYVPHTWRAARKIGGDTKWCTASSSDHYFNYYLNEYGGEYYDIIRKSDGAKFQLHVESNQFMDRKDNETNFSCIFNTRKEAEGLIRFLRSRGKDIEEWEPKTWFDEVEDLLNKGVDPDYVFDKVWSHPNEGLRSVELNKKINFIDTNGKLVLPDQWFDDAWDFYDGFAKVKIGGKYNYIKTNGKLVLPDQWFDDAWDFYDGFAKVKIGGKYNYIKTDGKLVSPDLWFDEAYNFYDGFGAIKVNGGWNYIKTNGELVSPDQWFEQAYNFDNGYGLVQLKQKFNFFMKNGKLLSQKLWFDGISSCGGGIYRVYLKGKHNFINETNGKLLSPNKWFDSASDFNDGFAAVTINHKAYFINDKGEFFGLDKNPIDPKTLQESKQRTIVLTETQARTAKHLLTESASLEKILKALSKDQDLAGRTELDGSQSELADLIMADPTSVTNDRGKFVGRYWKWIYNQYKQGNIHEGDIPELQAALNTYNVNKSQINKPIDSYNTLDELVEEIAQYDDSFKATRTLSKGEQELEKVYEDEYVTVYVPHTVEAARKIGGDTRWCTASPTSGEKHFNYYLNKYGGEYYDIIRKSDGAKFQIHPESGQFMDRENRCINFGYIFNTSEEAEGLIDFLESRDKNIRPWEPNVWFDEVEDLLNQGVDPQTIFDFVADSCYGISRVKLCGKYNYIDEDCKLLSPGMWFDFGFDFEKGFCIVRNNQKKWNIIKKDGGLVSPSLWFDGIYEPKNGVLRVTNDEKYNFINTNGKLLSPNLWFDYANEFVNGFSCVNKNGKWNFVKYDGELLSPDQWFDFAGDFNQYGYTIVILDNEYYTLHSDGSLS